MLCALLLRPPRRARSRSDGCTCWVSHGLFDWLVLLWARGCVRAWDTAVTQTPALEVPPLGWVDSTVGLPLVRGISRRDPNTDRTSVLSLCLVVKSYILIYFHWLKI